MRNEYGLIGEKLSHSFSPVIHSIIINEMNLDGSYHLFETKKAFLPKLINDLKEKQLKGVNVTIPYKVEVMEYLDAISPHAEKIGSINTIQFEDNQLVGYNTDYDGFKNMLLHSDILVKGKNIAVLGYGGASKAVIQYLIDAEAKRINIITRNPAQLHIANEDIQILAYKDLNSIKNDIIINCTPLGMYPNIDACPVNEKQLQNLEAVVDLIYNPLQTLFMRKAEAMNIKNINGLYMLVSQAARSQEIWNNVHISEKSLRNIYDEVLKKI